MKPIHVLILSGVAGDTRRYRSLHLAEQSQMAGMQVTLAHAWQPGLQALVSDNHFDVAVFQRVEMDQFIRRLLDVLKAENTLCLYDADDLVFDETFFPYIDSPDFADPIRASLYRNSMQRQRKMLIECDAALTSTEFLAGQIRALGKTTFVHPNAFSLPMLQGAQNALSAYGSFPDRVVMGYASGTPTHDHDFAVAASAIKTIMMHYPETHLWLAGEINPGTGWEPFGKRVRHIPKMRWQDVPYFLALMDINLAPLVAGNPFSESKSAIKYLEAALLKRPTLASACAAFPASIRHDENGYLASSTEEWTACLGKLVEDTELRRKMGAQAYIDVMQKDHPRIRSLQWHGILEQALALRQGTKSHPSQGQVPVPTVTIGIADDDLTDFEAIPASGWVQRAWATLWRRGPLELLGAVWVALRRWLTFIFPFPPRGN